VNKLKTGDFISGTSSTAFCVASSDSQFHDRDFHPTHGGKIV